MCTLVKFINQIWINLFTKSNDPMTKKSRNFISLNNCHDKGLVYTRSINKTIFLKINTVLNVYMVVNHDLFAVVKISLAWVKSFNFYNCLRTLRTSGPLAIPWLITVSAINSCFTLRVYCTISPPYSRL